MKAVYLYTNSSFQTSLRSDTLWGLIISALSILKPKKEIDLLVNLFLENNPPFLLSSVMGFMKNENAKIIHYFPKPIVCNFEYEINSAVKMTYYKQFKKLNVINQSIFEDLVNGNISDKDLFRNFVLYQELIEKSILIDDDKKKLEEFEFMFSNPLVKNELIMHNTIDRMSGSTLEKDDGGQLYYTDETFIDNNEGLFFLVEGDLSIIEPALRFLSHFGFGGNNTIGKGNFKYEVKDFNFNLPKEKVNSFITLSLFNPKQSELADFMKEENKDKLWYELDFRAGRIGVHFADDPSKNQKDIVANFKEGSTFPFMDEKFPGRILQTATSASHNIYNNGFAFKIPSNLKYD